MATTAADAIRGEIVRLAHKGLDLPEFASNAARVLRRAVPFDGAAIVALDPATALPVGKWAENSRTAGDELRAVCVGGSSAWGVIVLYRERGAPNFAPRDVELIASLSGEFAEALQRVSVQGDLEAQTGDFEAGLLLLDDEDAIEMASDAAAAWLDELDDGERLPLVVAAVAQRARAIACGETDVAAAARVRAASGRWVLVRGSVLRNGSRERTAVTLAPARTHELAALIVAAYGLTARERRVTELVAQGLSTAAIASRLHLSAFTVQDHLKSVFEKLGVSSRGELVARLFVDHYQAGGCLTDPRRPSPG